MRRLWMLLLELCKFLFHVLVVRAWCSLDFLGNFLARRGGFLCASLNLLCAAFHLFDGFEEPNDLVNVQLCHLSYRQRLIG